MIEALQWSEQFARDGLYAGFVVFLRVGTAMALMPAFGEQSVPLRIRLMLGIAFTLIVVSAVPSPQFLADLPAGLPLLAEIVAGLSIGISLRLFVLALQTAGAIVAQSTSLSQLFGVQGEPAPAIGHLMLISGLALAMIFGLHVKIVHYLLLSYEIFPAGQFVAGDLVSNWGVFLVAQAFELAFVLSAPFVLASFVYNMALGVINRAMPQMMVSFVGAPAITLGGMLLLILVLPLLLSTWNQQFGTFLETGGGGF